MDWRQEAFLQAGTDRLQDQVGEAVRAVLHKLLRTWAVVAPSLPAKPWHLGLELWPAGADDPPDIHFEMVFLQGLQPKPIAAGLMTWVMGVPSAVYRVDRVEAKVQWVRMPVLIRPPEPEAVAAPQDAPVPPEPKKQKVAGLDYYPPTRDRPWLSYTGLRAGRPKGFPRGMPQFVEIAEPSLKRLRHVADLVARYAIHPAHTAQRSWNPQADPGQAWRFELDVSQREASAVVAAAPWVVPHMALWLQGVLNRQWHLLDTLRARDAAQGHGWLLPTQMLLRIHVPAGCSSAGEAVVVFGFPNGCRVEHAAHCKVLILV